MESKRKPYLLVEDLISAMLFILEIQIIKEVFNIGPKIVEQSF